MSRKPVSEEYFEEVCKKAKLSYRRIPENYDNTADYYLVTGDETSIVEVKEKRDDVQKKNEFNKTLKAGKVADHQETIGSQRSIRQILDGAAKQIDASSKTGSEYKIIWFHGTGIDKDAQFSQSICTAYGTTGLMHFIPAEDFDYYECYYCEFNFFFDNPQITCLIVTNGRNHVLCINNFYKHQEKFYNSKTFAQLATFCNVIDPLKEESKEKKLLVADCNISRSDEQAIFKYLNKKYGLSIQKKMKMTRYTGAILSG